MARDKYLYYTGLAFATGISISWFSGKRLVHGTLSEQRPRGERKVGILAARAWCGVPGVCSPNESLLREAEQMLCAFSSHSQCREVP